MNEMIKLRYGLMVMLILLTVSIVGAYVVAVAEEEAVVNAIYKLNQDELNALMRYSNMLPDYTGVYGLFGLMMFAIEIGLIIVTWKVWHVKEIPS